MEVKFNPVLGGYQILHAKRYWTRPSIWGKPINDKIYESQAEAWDYLDRISS